MQESEAECIVLAAQCLVHLTFFLQYAVVGF
jgi:hypothetical protein